MIKPYDIEVIEYDDSYIIYGCVGYFIKDGIFIAEIEDGSRELIKEFARMLIPKEWQDEIQEQE